MGEHHGRWSSSATLFREGHAIRPRPYLAHEFMESGVIFSAPWRVAFVSAVLVIDEDDHAALADFLDGFFDSGELERSSVLAEYPSSR